MNGFVDWILDRSILYSFDRSGFERHARRFHSDDLDVDLSGCVCLVTGANSGIGFETSRQLAKRGARMWLLCRNRRRGAEARESIRRETGKEDVHVATIDVSSLASVRAFARRFREERVDILIHNAGVLPDRREVTDEGIELTLATNVVGPFLLTRLLAGKLRAARASRVVFVSSGGMYPEKLSLEDLDWTKRPFDGVRAYAQTKRMQVVLSELWAERSANSSTFCACMHPGWADTPAVRTSLPRFWSWMKSRLRTPAQGADTVVWLAVCRRIAAETGRFWFDRMQQPTHLLPFTRENDEDREKLWQLCEGRTASGPRTKCSAPSAELKTER